MILHAYTIVHTLISVVAIVAGLVVAYGLLTAQRLERWTGIFLGFTVATSVTGFFFPFHGFTPAIGLGIISMCVLPVAIYARYRRQMTGRWRAVYVITAMLSLYFNLFVLIVQLFLKIPALHALAPTQTEAPFKFAQLSLLVLIIALTVIATLR